MTTLILTPDEAAQVPTGYVVVEGEPCDACLLRAGFPPVQPDGWHGCSHFVAPKRWADLDTACDSVRPFGCGLGAPFERPRAGCPACNGSGRTIHELRAAGTTHHLGLPIACAGNVHVGNVIHLDGHKHTVVKVGGSALDMVSDVPVFSGSIEVLPVYEGTPPGEIDAVCLLQTHDGQGWFLWRWDDADATPITLAREPVPGRDFVAALTEAK